MTRSDWLWLAACVLSGTALGLSIARTVCIVRDDYRAQERCRQDCERHGYRLTGDVCDCRGAR